jgi:hypothetical protein
LSSHCFDCQSQPKSPTLSIAESSLHNIAASDRVKFESQFDKTPVKSAGHTAPLLPIKITPGPGQQPTEMVEAEMNSSLYDTLKHQVHQLKLEQQSLAGHRAKQKEVG